MAIKYLEAEKLRLETRKKLTATPENWMQFLRTASNTYKYSYSDQLMIAAQFPNATAVGCSFCVQRPIHTSTAIPISL